MTYFIKWSTLHKREKGKMFNVKGTPLQCFFKYTGFASTLEIDQTNIQLNNYSAN